MNETKNWMIETIITVIIFILSITLLVVNIIEGFKFFVIGYLIKEVIMCLVRQFEELWKRYEEL